MANQTKEDAFAHIALAQMGTLAGNPSEEYCLKMREQLYLWIERIDQHLYNMDMEAFKREEERQEEEFVLTHPSKDM